MALFERSEIVEHGQLSQLFRNICQFVAFCFQLSQLLPQSIGLLSGILVGQPFVLFVYVLPFKVGVA